MTILADFVVILHLLFIVFALFGALLSLKWKKAAYIHVPAAIWATMVEVANLPCPLTPIEKWLIEREGLSAYRGSFVEHYILSILYPGQLDALMRWMLGVAVLLSNVGIYVWILRRKSKNGLI